MYLRITANSFPGIFKNEPEVTAYIDLNGIAELRSHAVTQESVVLGGGITLTQAIDLLRGASKLGGYEYTEDLAKHWGRVANVAVRNVRLRRDNVTSQLFRNYDLFGLICLGGHDFWKPHDQAQAQGVSFRHILDARRRWRKTGNK